MDIVGLQEEVLDTLKVLCSLLPDSTQVSRFLNSCSTVCVFPLYMNTMHMNVVLSIVETCTFANYICCFT